MAALSPAIAERSRKNATAIFRAIASTKQVRLAELLGVSEATVSRLLSEGEIERIGQLLAACRLKVVHEDAQTVEPELMQALSVLAARGAHHVATPSGFGEMHAP